MTELLWQFGEAEVRYLIVGGYAVGVHAQPRFTKDLDVWVDPSPENAERVFEALRRFGAPLKGVTPADFATRGTVFQVGIAPNRIDILTEISAVEFNRAWSERHVAHLGQLSANVIGADALLENKRASARPQDLLDVKALELARGLRRRR